MNRYQRQRSKEIKQIMKSDEFGLVTYSQARRYWNWLHGWIWRGPCSSCSSDCRKYETKLPIAYCPNQVTPDKELICALKLLPQVMISEEVRRVLGLKKTDNPELLEAK